MFVKCNLKNYRIKHETPRQQIMFFFLYFLIKYVEIQITAPWWSANGYITTPTVGRLRTLRYQLNIKWTLTFTILHIHFMVFLENCLFLSDCEGAKVGETSRLFHHVNKCEIGCEILQNKAKIIK